MLWIKTASSIAAAYPIHNAGVETSMGRVNDSSLGFFGRKGRVKAKVRDKIKVQVQSLL